MTGLLEGRTLFEKGNFRAARELWTQTLDKTVSSDVRSGLLACIGATHLKQGNGAEAVRWFKRAADSVETVLPATSELTSSFAGSERRWYHDITIETLLREGRAGEAFDYSERARARAFLQLIGNHRVDSARGAKALMREAETLRARITELERGGNTAKRDLAAARKSYETLMVRVKASNPEYASFATVEPLRIENVRRELPAATTLISYYVSTYGVRAWIVDRDSIHSVALPFDHASLERTIAWATGFRSGAPRGMVAGDARRKTPDGAREAFDLLFRPLRRYVRNTRLIVIPHGELHYVPFAALRDGGSGRHLLEDYTLTFLPSASALRFLRAKETPVDGRALILGNPISALDSLPGSKREAAAVARDLATTAKIGTFATEDLLYRFGGHVDLLHIAAHGVYDAANPLFSYILLSPTAARDGKLEVHEILSAVDLTGVNLVVLSACQTASGKRGGGDDIVGLTRAILYAGSPGVISTLWDIDDDASALLMRELYRRLREGSSAADALHEAQLALLRTDAYADPQFWAAFTITGDPRGRWGEAVRR